MSSRMDVRVGISLRIRPSCCRRTLIPQKLQLFQQKARPNADFTRSIFQAAYVPMHVPRVPEPTCLSKPNHCASSQIANLPCTSQARSRHPTGQARCCPHPFGAQKLTALSVATKRAPMKSNPQREMAFRSIGSQSAKMETRPLRSKSVRESNGRG